MFKLISPCHAKPEGRVIDLCILTRGYALKGSRVTCTKSCVKIGFKNNLDHHIKCFTPKVYCILLYVWFQFKGGKPFVLGRTVCHESNDV